MTLSLLFNFIRSGLLNQGFDVERNSGYGGGSGRNNTMDDDTMTPQQYRQHQEQVIRGMCVCSTP